MILCPQLGFAIACSPAHALCGLCDGEAPAGKVNRTMALSPLSLPDSKKVVDMLYPKVIIVGMTPEGLKRWREANGYSQQRLADALGVFQVTVARWETDVRKIPSFLHLALEALEARGGEKKPRGTKKKMGKEGKGNAKG